MLTISVIGTGAIGGYYGAKLARGGQDVHFLLHRDYEYVKEHGLYVKSCDGDFRLDKVNAYNTTEKMPKSDVVIVGLKTTNQSMLKTLLPPLLKDDTVVVLIQNGLGMEKDFALRFPGVSVMAGLAFICSSKTEPGIVNHQCFGQIRLGNYNCVDRQRIDEFADALQQAGVKTTMAEFHEARWKKAVWNIPFNGMSVVHNTTTDQLIANPDTARLILEQMREVIDVAQACGVRKLDYSFADEMMEVTKTMVPYSPSMKLDYQFHRPMEIHYLYVRPLNAALTRNCPTPEIRKLAARLMEIDRVNTHWGNGEAEDAKWPVPPFATSKIYAEATAQKTNEYGLVQP